MAIRASEGARIEQLHNTRYKPLELTSDNLGIIYLYADHSPQLIKSKHLYLPMYRLDRVRANKNTAEEQMHSGVAILRIFLTKVCDLELLQLNGDPMVCFDQSVFRKKNFKWQMEAQIHLAYTAPNNCTGQGLQYIKQLQPSHISSVSNVLL